MITFQKKENASKYKLQDGRKIKSAEYNIPFDRHPDIGKNVLDDGTIVPCEIEWVTTNYNKHKHDVNALIEANWHIFLGNRTKLPLKRHVLVHLDERRR